MRRILLVGLMLTALAFMGNSCATTGGYYAPYPQCGSTAYELHELRRELRQQEDNRQIDAFLDSMRQYETDLHRRMYGW